MPWIVKLSDNRPCWYTDDGASNRTCVEANADRFATEEEAAAALAEERRHTPYPRAEVVEVDAVCGWRYQPQTDVATEDREDLEWRVRALEGILCALANGDRRYLSAVDEDYQGLVDEVVRQTAPPTAAEVVIDRSPTAPDHPRLQLRFRCARLNDLQFIGAHGDPWGKSGGGVDALCYDEAEVLACIIQASAWSAARGWRLELIDERGEP